MIVSIWKTRIFDAQGNLVNCSVSKNILHLEGEKYILSTAFMTGLSGFGKAPEKLYVGIDSRSVLLRRNTLADATSYEPKANGYKRMSISTENGFSAALESPTEPVDQYGEANQKVFSLRASLKIKASADYGQVHNYFLTTASEGTQGALIISSPLRHPFEMWEGWSLEIEPVISLRAALIAPQESE